MPGNKLKPKVGEIWMVGGGNCIDIVLLVKVDDIRCGGPSIDCSNVGPNCGWLYFGSQFLIRRIQEAAK